jgi:chromosome segregation ATPase
MENRTPNSLDIFNIINILRDKIENCLNELHAFEIKSTTSNNDTNINVQDKFNILDKRITDELHTVEILKSDASHCKQDLINSLKDFEEELEKCKSRINLNESSINKINETVKPFSKALTVIFSVGGTVGVTLLIALLKGWLKL